MSRKHHLRFLTSMVLSLFMMTSVLNISTVFAEEEPVPPVTEETAEPETAEEENEVKEEAEITVTEEEVTVTEETEMTEETPEAVSEETALPEVISEETDTELPLIEEEAVEETSEEEEPVMADDGTVSDWQLLQEKLNAGGTVELEKDYFAGPDDPALVVPAGVSVTLSLEGHTISRNREEAEENGHVITVKGTLSLYDNVGTGQITGGKSTGAGGGVYVTGTFNMFSGTICGNSAEVRGSYGQGIGGGVHVSGAFNMYGGEISGNTAYSGGGVGIYGENANVHIVDSTIKNNRALTSGGAFSMRFLSELHIGGETVVTGNEAAEHGGAIWNNNAERRIYLSGSPVISGNTAKYMPNDIESNFCALYIESTLNENAKIGIHWNDDRLPSLDDRYNECQVTSGYLGKASIASFFSNIEDYELTENDMYSGTELFFSEIPVVINFDANGGTGEMKVQKIHRHSGYELPECGFTAPEGKVFAGWLVNGEIKQPKATIDVDIDPVILTAQWASAWSALQTKINTSDNGAVISLWTNITASADETRLVVPRGKSVIIDLCGYSVSRGLTSKTENGNVFYVEGDLTIRDSGGTGTITGGNTSVGAGILVDGGKLTLEGGSIEGNQAGERQSLADEGGGGIYLSNSVFTMTGGRITGNHGGYGGAIYSIDSEIVMSGGSITGNTATYGGGAIFFEFMHSKKFSVSGSPVIKDNLTGSKASDVYLSLSQKFIVTGPLSDDALLCFTTYSRPLGPGFAVTEGLDGNGKISNFRYDTAGYLLEANDAGEAVVREPLTEPEFKGHQLVLSGTLGLKFGVRFPEGYDLSGSYMTFTVNGEEQKVTTEEAETISATRKAYTCKVNTLQMAETITAVFHYGNGEFVESTYSVTDYISHFDRHESEYSAETISLVRAVADYGYYAQPYLINLHKLGDKYAKMEKHYAESYDYASILSAVSDYAYSKDILSSQLKNASYKLSLDADTVLSFLILPGEASSVSGSAVFNGTTYNAEKQEDGTYVIRIPGIKASDLGTMITVTGDAGGTYTLKASALSYVRSILNRESSSAEVKNAVSALYKYYEAVKQYRP